MQITHETNSIISAEKPREYLKPRPGIQAGHVLNTSALLGLGQPPTFWKRGFVLVMVMRMRCLLNVDYL